MLVHRPENRWPVQKLLERLAKILAQSSHQDNATEYCTVGRPRETNYADKFPPLWDEDEYGKRCRPHLDSQPSTLSDFHDMGQLENVFADDIMVSRSSGPEHVRPTNTATRPLPPRDIYMPQNGPSLCDNHSRKTSKAITDTFRQKLSLKRGPPRVHDQLLDLSPGTVYKHPPYTDLLRVNENIRVAQPDFLSTPGTSYFPPSSDAHSTCTEDPRASVSSRTDESVLEIEENSEQPRPSEDFHSVDIKDMSKPEVLLSPPEGGTILNSVERTDGSPASEDTETRSLPKHGLILLWKKLRSLRRRVFRPILRRGRRHEGG